MRFRTKFNFFAIFLILVVIVPPAIFAGAGDIDPTFNRGKGYSLEALDGGGDVAAAAMQPDGKIVMAGRGDYGSTSAFFATRFNVDGSLDTTFGYNGRSLTSFGGRIYNQAGVASAAASNVLIQPDGKILLVGNLVYYTEPSGFAEMEVALVRLNADGSPDPTFDGDGKVRIPKGSLSFQRAYAFALMPDGKIEVFGRIFNALGVGGALLRLNSDGSRDRDFGKNGLFVYDGLSGYTMVVQPDGKTVIGGQRTGSGTGFCTFRVNYNGELDTSFNGTGFAPIPSGIGSGSAENLLLQPDGKIIAEGQWYNYTAMMRYNPDGTFDNSFGEFGFAYFSRDSNHQTKAVLQPDGKIVIASSIGSGAHTPDYTVNLWLFRFNQNGSPDITFNGSGSLIERIRKTDELASGVFLRPDGKILVTGDTDQGKAIAVQFGPDGSRDPSFGANGIASWSIGYAYGVISDMAVLTDNKILAVGGNVLVRYMSNGEADLSFGSAGRGVRIGDSNTGINGMALRYDGKIALAGERVLDPTVNANDSDAILALYNPDGTIDTSFGASGKITVPFGSASHDTFQDVIIQPNGKLIAVGYRFSQNQQESDAVVARFNADGSIDPSFGKNGIVITHPCSSGLNANGFAAAVQVDGKVLVSGICGAPAVFRFNEDGSPDLAFGKSGVAMAPGVPYGAAYDMKLQSDGSIVVAGYAQRQYSSWELLVARFLPDGSPDPSFNGSGVVLVGFGARNGTANSLEIQPDGKILVAGQGSDGGGAVFKILRFNSNGILDSTFWGRNGVVTFGFDYYTSANALAIDGNGRVVVGGSSGGLFGIVRLSGDIGPLSFNESMKADQR